MNITIQIILIVCPLIFLAGFIDSIAGGGGLISLPAYLFAGLPMHNAIATNKFSSTFGTAISTYRYIKSGSANLKSALASVVGALVGSYAGARLALALDEKYLQYFLIIALPVIAVFVLTRKNFGKDDTAFNLPPSKVVVFSVISGFVIGAYDGFFGPGTGTFLILAYTGIIGFNLKTASGNAKIVNLASNVAALITFIFSNKVMFQIGIPAALCGTLGNWLGSGLAIKKGSGVIKPFIIVVILLLFGKIFYDLILS